MELPVSLDVLYVIGGTIWAIIRASGVTIETGSTGLLYSLGRTDRPAPLVLRPFLAVLQQVGWLRSVPRSLLQPGFHPLMPFLQRVRRVPTRQRTMDLPAQRVATFEGYVFQADANIVFRVVDVRRALIMVDDLLQGMRQMLTLGVQDVLREAGLRELQSGAGLDEKLRANLEERVRVWGVVVERAGFPTITPSPRTLRITQLRQNTLERERRVEMLTGADDGRRAASKDTRPLSIASAVGAVGTRRVFRTKVRARRVQVAARRNALRLRAALERKGWTGAEIQRGIRSLQRKQG